MPPSVVADASKADEAASNVVEDDSAVFINNSVQEERSVMAGIAKDLSPTDDLVYNSDAVKSSVMDSHAVVLGDCNRILKDRKAAKGVCDDADSDDADFARTPPASFSARPREEDADGGDATCRRGPASSASQRAADASAVNRLA